MNDTLIHFYTDSKKVHDFFGRTLNKYVLIYNGLKLDIYYKYVINVFMINEKIYLDDSKIEYQENIVANHRIPRKILYDKHFKLISDEDVKDINIGNNYFFFGQFHKLTDHTIRNITHSIICEKLKTNNLILLHGNALRINDKNVMFLGKGDSGKTSALINLMTTNPTSQYIEKTRVILDTTENIFFRLNMNCSVGIKNGILNERPELSHYFRETNKNYLNIRNHFGPKREYKSDSFNLDMMYILDWDHDSSESEPNFKVAKSYDDYKIQPGMIFANKYSFANQDLMTENINFAQNHLLEYIPHIIYVTGKFDMNKLCQDVENRSHEVN